MKSYNSIFLLSDSKCKACLFSLFITMSLICGAYFLGTAWLGTDSFRLSSGIGFNTNTQQYAEPVKCEVQVTKKLDIQVHDIVEKTHIDKCNEKCRPVGSEALPKGIVSTTSNLKMQPLSGPIQDDKNSKQTSLLALPVGIKQKKLVNEIVTKFIEKEFAVMLFHYDGLVDEWREFEWNDRVIHVSAINQTKWWFAKRFLHPDIVAEYEYIFLWDEDLGVEHFHPDRYVSIIKEEGLEISQPGLDRSSTEIHHQITVRGRSKVHRRYYRLKGGESGRCDNNSTAPPCVGWVEMMAPVFSRSAWRCAWYMVQNDLIHAWGLDMQLGYCAQGDRTAKVGVVDQEYIVHLGLPTLGGASDKNKITNTQALKPKISNKRYAVRKRSYEEMRVFRSRWEKAVKEDKCWIDPFETQAAAPRTS